MRLEFLNDVLNYPLNQFVQAKTVSSKVCLGIATALKIILFPHRKGMS